MPADYINKLARMFQDIKVSNDLNQGFKKEYQNKGDIAGTVLKMKRGHCMLRIISFSSYGMVERETKAREKLKRKKNHS